MEDQRNLSYCSTCGCDKIFKKDGLDAWICNECGNKYNLEAARIYSDNIHEGWEAWKFRLGCAGCLVSTVAVIVFIVVFGINLFSTFEDISARDLLFFLTMGYFYAGLLQFYMDHHFPTFIGLLTWPKAHVKYIPGSILPEVWQVQKHSSKIYRSFIFFLISIPQWGVVSFLILIIYKTGESYSVAKWAMYGLIVWVLIPFLNLVFIVPAMLVRKIAWLFWAPVLALFLPKQKR